MPRSRSRTLRVPVELDAEIERRAAQTNRSYANVVMTILLAAVKPVRSEPEQGEPLPKIAKRH